MSEVQIDSEDIFAGIDINKKINYLISFPAIWGQSWWGQFWPHSVQLGLNEHLQWTWSMYSLLWCLLVPFKIQLHYIKYISLFFKINIILVVLTVSDSTTLDNKCTFSTQRYSLFLTWGNKKMVRHVRVCTLFYKIMWLFPCMLCHWIAEYDHT